MHSTAGEAFFRRGWIRFAHDESVAQWVESVRPVAERCAADTEHRARWLRSGGTWFVGVNVLPNDARGAIADEGVPPLGGAGLAFIARVLGLRPELDRGQVSVCLPCYPRRSAGESESVFRFRRERDAAHVDALKRGDGRRRRLGEPHGFILGVPLTDAPVDAAPLVVWEGSHEIIRAAFLERLAALPPSRWGAEDVTDVYRAARRRCFELCARVVVHARPGECYLIHRLALHGIAPWTATPVSERSIVYFRPNPFPGEPPGWWLDRP